MQLSDHDFAQRNSCSDTNPGTVGEASDQCTGVIFASPAACLRQGRVPGCAPGGAVTVLSRRQRQVTKEKATPLPVSPSLRYGATCGARFRRGPRTLAWRLKQRAALIRLKLCSSARTEGIGSSTAFRVIAALGPGHRVEGGAESGAGTVSAARVLCHSCLRRRIQVTGDERRLSFRSCHYPVRPEKLSTH